MLYLILKPLMRLAIWLYFGKIRREGLEHIDNGRPSLIIANHTASFMDAMITAVSVKRRIWFFTRGDVFRARWTRFLLRGMGMLPIYRMRDGKDRLQENEESNSEALRILEKGGAVLIFAEGASAVDKVMKPMKKGPFRLAVRAADANLDPLIVPLGINYVLPASARGDAYLVAAAPYGIPQGDADTATRRTTELMRRSAAALDGLCWHIEYPVLRPAAQFLLEHLEDVEPNAPFRTSHRLTSTFNHLNYRSADALLRDWEEFRIWQRHYPLPKALFLRRGTWRDYLVTIAGLPLALAALLLHLIPMAFASYFTRQRVKEADFVSPVFLCLSVFLNLLWYAAVIAICFAENRPDRLWIPLLLMPVGGIFLIKLWIPAYRFATAPLIRKIYRQRNPSHALVFRFYELLLQIGWMMAKREEGEAE